MHTHRQSDKTSGHIVYLTVVVSFGFVAYCLKLLKTEVSPYGPFMHNNEKLLTIIEEQIKILTLSRSHTLSLVFVSSKMINLSQPDTIDERVINTKKMSTFTMTVSTRPSSLL